MFVVAFGHGKHTRPVDAPHERAHALRMLLDRACRATFHGFPPRAQVSVAPGGVMFAFHDDDLDRAIQLCEAVASQLAGYVHTYTTLLPVCAVLTHGHMRQVQETVLGHATNFEGRPAIAAARILAQLEAGQMAVEVGKPEGEFSLLTRHLQGPVVLLRDRKHASDQGLPPPGQAEYLDLLRAVCTMAPADEPAQRLCPGSTRRAW